MEGLSKEIAAGLDSVIDGLSYDIGLEHHVKDFENFPNFVDYEVAITHKSGFKTKGKIHDAEEHSLVIRTWVKGEPKDTRVLYTKIRDAKVWQSEDVLLTDDKMLTVIKGKVQAFSTAKTMLGEWVKSPNAPSRRRLNSYADRLHKAGNQALKFFRKALAQKIDFEALDPTKHAAATAAKPVLLDAVFQLSRDLKSLEVQREEEQYDFEEKEFEVGWAERYGTGKIFPRENYHKDWYNEKEKAIKICPFGTQGEILEISGLKIQLPRVPRDKSKILFSDLPSKEQYWRRVPPPKNISKRNIDQYYDYIMEEYRRRREGVWFMNKGKATYLTGNAYFGLQWGRMLDNRGYKNFRIAQLKMLYHMEACIVDPRCFGQIFLKSRRTGFTYWVIDILLNQGTGIVNGKLGMTSKTSTDAAELWDKVSYAFQSLPFWMRPVVKGKVDSTTHLEFAKPSDNSKDSKKNENLGIDDYLQTTIDWRTTTNGAYDSVKLDFYFGDECGKWEKPNDYITHLATVRPTMMPNGRVVGKAFIGSTMGAMKQGGEQFKQLIKGSMPQDRNPVTHKTPTALYYHFLPAQENMEEYTDIYGKCWQKKPSVSTKNVLGDKIKEGSIDRLLAQEEQAAKVGDKALNSQYRTYPRIMEHAMRDESSECVFNMTKLYQQIENNENEAEEQLYAIGNFDWKNVKDGEVVFNHNTRGRFKVSWFPSKVDGTEHLANRVRTTNGKHYPLNGDAIRFGCDPFSLKSTHGKGSKGGLHGKTMMFAPNGVPSNEFVVEYLARPDDEYTFFEDVIKCIRFYGAPILVESNRIDLLRHMRNRGYRGFAMDRLDRPKDKLNANEKAYGGQVMSSKDMLDSHQNAIGQWITDYVGVYEDEVRQIRSIGEMGKMPFTETLKDWLGFDPDNRTAYDATVSSGLAIMACQTERYKGEKRKKPKRNLKSYVQVFDNTGQTGRPKKIIYGS